MVTGSFGSFVGFPRTAFAWLLLPFCLWACGSTPAVIRDIEVHPQDALHYLDGTASEVLIDADRHAALDREFDRRYFAPWHRQQPVYSRSEMEKELLKFRKNPGFGENKRAHAPDWIESMAARANLEHYPDAGFAGVTVVNSDLRVLPTHRPHFDSADGAGTGYPFDNLQNSALHANTPVFVSHRSADKAWVFVESHSGFGWLPARDVARVDEAFVAQWENRRLITVLEDESPVFDGKGMFLFSANAGALFPLSGEDPDAYRVLVAVPDENRNAEIRGSRLLKTHARVKPLPLTRRNIASVANIFLNKPYGWGGIYQNRDCSSTLKDLFTPFGIWLPRHSSDQALHGGYYMDLCGLGPTAKERVIVRDGSPYLSLLWLKGHIMLYLGTIQGQPLVLHNMWGVRTRRLLQREGRLIIGRAVITTLRPGSELRELDRSGGGLLDKLQGMTLLITPPTPANKE
ncbi:MAG TPA: NlpC/P60 family N-terminal domain-containing protein [Syntrophobacter fumaroxidans]|nr:NlpC/P60 family N-terminal domain-containing protein [Syntrophobacter fumaroxidans]